MSDRMLNANTATAEELKGIPGVNDKIAQLILRFKEIYGVVRKEALILALRGDVSPDVLDQIDFSLPRIDDPFDLDCLPAVPKTNLLEKPMVSFKKQQMASRRSSPHESRSRSPESLNNLLEFYEKMSSPVEKTLALLKKEFSDKDELHSSRTSHTSPVNKKGDKRQLLGSRQTYTSDDRTTCGSKSTSGPSASSRVKSKLSTARDSRSRCSSGSRSPDSHRSAIKQKTTKTRKSSESRSRSPSSKKVARQQKKIKTRNSSRSRSGRRKSRLNRSYSRSSSRSKSRSGHHLKRSYRKVEKKNRSSSRSGSRSSSVRYHSRKSKKSHKSSQADSRSSSRSPSQSVGRGSTSRTGHHSKRKVVRKNRKSRSDSRSTRHSRKSVLKHGKSKSHRRSRSTSRSSSRSNSRSSSSHSRSHKGHTRSQKVKHKSRHKNRHHSSSSTSSSSCRSPSRSRSHRTKRSKSRKLKRSSSSSSQSPSRSRSHRTKRSKSRKLKRSSSSQSPSRSRSHRTKRSKSRKSKRSSSSSHSRSRSQGRKKTRSHKSRRSKRHASLSSDSDSSYHRHSYRHGNPRKHPKALRFDGKTNWLSFKKKFNSYRKVMKWSETESKDYLMWSLEGKALDFFTITSDIERYSFRKIIKKLEARFGVKELTETSKVKFQQASQRPDESLEDWADRVMTLATPAFVDLPEDHLKQEAIAKFSQGCCDKDAGKHACFEHPSTMEEALNLVKHHQYISQAVDGKQSKKENDVSVNAVQSTSEDRIEQLIASAIEEFANKLQVRQQPYHQPAVNKTQQSADEKWKSSVQCFFCKNFGHLKRECRVYQSWLQKQQSKADNLSDQGQGKESTYDTFQIGKVSLLKRKNIEPQHSKESKVIERASCSKYTTDSDSMAPKPTGTNSKSRLKKRSQAKNVAVDSGTSSTKTVQKMFQGGTFSTKTDRTLQDGTSSTKTEQKFQNRNLQGGTSSTKTEQKFQNRNLQDGTSSTKTEQKFQDRNLQDGTSSTKTDQKFQNRNLQDGTSSTKTEQKFQDRNLQDGTSSTKTDQKFQDRNLQGGTSSTKTDQKFQDGNLQDGTSSTKTDQKFQDGNLQDGTSSTKTEQKFQDGNLQGGTSSTKTDQKFQDGNLQGGTSSTKTDQKFQDRNLQGGTSSTKTDQKFQDGNLQDGTSSTKTDQKFQDGNLQDGTSSTKTDRNLQDGTSSAKTVPKFQDGTSSTKTDRKLQDGTSSAETVPKFQEGTSSTKTDGNLQDGTSSAKTVPMFQDGTSSTKTNGNLQDGTSSAKTVPKFQDGTSSTRKDKKLQEGTFSAKTVRNFQDDTYCTKTDGEFLNYKREEGVYIHQVRAGSSFVQLKVGSIDINARIDSGAEITILSSKIYEKLYKAPAKVKEVGLQMADKDTVMKGFIIQPLKMKLGNQCFSERVYVASIGEDMLLGHDLLHHLGVCLDMRTDTLILNEEQIPVTTSFNNNTPTVARVSVKQKVRLPPNTRSRKQHQSIGRASSSPMFHRQK